MFLINWESGIPKTFKRVGPFKIFNAMLNEPRNNSSHRRNLSNDEMRRISGGKASFPCTVHEADGSVRRIEAESIEECLDFAFPQ